MKFCLRLLLLTLICVIPSVASHATVTNATFNQAMNLEGRWRVKFTVAGVEKNLILITQARGVASFLLQDTGPDDKPVADPQPAAWSQLTNNRVSFSGEAELPIGTCCREIGTVSFKGKFSSNNSISGKVIFVTSIDEDESPYQFKSAIGTFTATRIPK